MSYVYVITDDPIENEEALLFIETVKIGYTGDKNIYNRLRQLQTGNPRPLSIVEIHEFQNDEMAKQIEKLCHWNLSGHGLTGEWFQYTNRVKTILGYIGSLSNYYPWQRLEDFFTTKGVKNV